jgi:DNA-binding HxlR family transcriptional regulator
MGKKRKKKMQARDEFRLGDEFDQSLDELIAKGFIERVGTDKPDGEPKYAFTEKAKDIFELMNFVKATDAILKEHGRR